MGKAGGIVGSGVAWAALAMAAPVLSVAPMLSASAHAQAVDPAQAPVDQLHDALIASMKAAQGGAKESARAQKLGPVIDRVYDIPQMARISVGSAWVGFSPADQVAMVQAFRAMTLAQYASNFDGYTGERFVVQGAPELRGLDKVVRTLLISPKGSSEALAYRLRESGGQWRIVDVIYRQGISELATRRADFAAVLAKGGAQALIAHLNKLANNPK
jgi:phospholipid transport system substrate-binding protein